MHGERQELTIKHGDIPGLMPGMTMSYPVARPDLMQGRVPGELITATLEVGADTGRLVEITHTGQAPLSQDSNEIAMAAGVLNMGDAVPDVALIDQDNRRRSLSEWRGTPTVITFIYTECPLPTFCPLMDQNFATIQRMASEDPALKGRIRLISVSFDPDHDTPAVLKQHAAHMKADPAVWTFLTGDRVTIDRVAAEFGVNIIREAGANSQITHSLRTTLIGADGRVRRAYSSSDWTPGQVISDLRTELAGR